MDYEQRYKNALAKAREIHRNEDERSFDMEWLFPELRESEDEKIKKTLIDYFITYKKQEECGIKTFFGIPTDNVIAWVEKQGQKPAWSEEDEVKINRIVACLENLNVADNDILLKDVDWLKSFKDRIQPQPKQEWSEDDEEKFRDVIRLIEQGAPVQSMRDHYTNWFESLKERIGG